MSMTTPNMSTSLHSKSQADQANVATNVSSILNWKLILLPLLFVAVVFVAIKTVVHRHQARSLFVEAQRLEKERDVLAAQWSRLKLEQGTVLNQVSVERQARWDLNMRIPKTAEIKMIAEPFSNDVDLVEDEEQSSVLKKVSLSD